MGYETLAFLGEVRVGVGIYGEDGHDEDFVFVGEVIMRIGRHRQQESVEER